MFYYFGGHSLSIAPSEFEARSTAFSGCIALFDRHRSTRA